MKGTVLAHDLEEQVLRLLRADPPLSQRKISRLTGVSRGTIAQRAREGRRPPRQIAQAFIESLPRGPVERCPVHGFLVKTPCLACRLESIGRRLRPLARTRDGDPLALDLRGDDLVRYRGVKRQMLERLAREAEESRELRVESRESEENCDEL
jgi:transcriptional regulator with XRE-family HTH domain